MNHEIADYLNRQLEKSGYTKLGVWQSIVGAMYILHCRYKDERDACVVYDTKDRSVRTFNCVDWYFVPEQP